MKKENQFTVDYFIKKFEAIPENKWTIRKFGDNDVHCAYGHCGCSDAVINNFFPSTESGALKEISNAHAIYMHIVNDGDDPRYQQPTPKQRILAALHDIKKLQEKESPAPQEPPYRTVVIDSKVKSLTEKELQLS